MQDSEAMTDTPTITLWEIPESEYLRQFILDRGGRERTFHQVPPDMNAAPLLREADAGNVWVEV
jgi:hypothetical protein